MVEAAGNEGVAGPAEFTRVGACQICQRRPVLGAFKGRGATMIGKGPSKQVELSSSRKFVLKKSGAETTGQSATKWEEVVRRRRQGGKRDPPY